MQWTLISQAPSPVICSLQSDPGSARLDPRLQHRDAPHPCTRGGGRPPALTRPWGLLQTQHAPLAPGKTSRTKRALLEPVCSQQLLRPSCTSFWPTRQCSESLFRGRTAAVGLHATAHFQPCSSITFIFLTRAEAELPKATQCACQRAPC